MTENSLQCLRTFSVLGLKFPLTSSCKQVQYCDVILGTLPGLETNLGTGPERTGGFGLTVLDWTSSESRTAGREGQAFVLFRDFSATQI